MLRGNHPARIDDKGRLKVPNGFRTVVESQWGAELFITSVTGEYVRLYPMAVWLEIERGGGRGPPARRRGWSGTSASLACRTTSRSGTSGGCRRGSSRRSPSPTRTGGSSRSMGSDDAHVPVLLAETLELLAGRPGGVWGG